MEISFWLLGLGDRIHSTTLSLSRYRISRIMPGVTLSNVMETWQPCKGTLT